MVSMMRGRLGKHFYKTVLWLTLIAMAGTTLIAALLGRRGLGLNRGGSAAALVNGVEITSQALMRKSLAIEHEIREIKAALGPYASEILRMRMGYDEKNANPRKIAMDQLVQEQLLLQAAQKLGIKTISPLYASEKLDDNFFVLQYLSAIIPPNLISKNERIDRTMLRQFLQRQGMSTIDFEAQVNDAISLSLVPQLLMSTVHTPSIEKIVSQEAKGATRSFTFITLSLSAYLDAQREEKVSDAVLKGFFERENARMRRYWSAETRSGTLWTFSKESFDLVTSEGELRRYFNQHKKDYGEKSFEKVKDEIAKLLAQEQFQKRFVASARSLVNDRLDEKESAKHLNDFVEKYKGKKQVLGAITRDHVEKNSDAALLFTLSQPGRKTFASRKEYGVVVQLDERVASKMRPFEEVRGIVLADYQKEEAQKALFKDLERIAKQAVGVKDLSSVARLGKGATLKSYEGVVPGDGTWEKWTKEGYPTRRFEYMIHPGYALTHFEAEKGVIVVLTSYKPSVKKNEPGELDSSFVEGSMQRNFAALIADLKSSAKIEYRKEKAAQSQVPLDLV